MTHNLTPNMFEYLGLGQQILLYDESRNNIVISKYNSKGGH